MYRLVVSLVGGWRFTVPRSSVLLTLGLKFKLKKSESFFSCWSFFFAQSFSGWWLSGIIFTFTTKLLQNHHTTRWTWRGKHLWVWRSTVVQLILEIGNSTPQLLVYLGASYLLGMVNLLVINQCTSIKMFFITPLHICFIRSVWFSWYVSLLFRKCGSKRIRFSSWLENSSGKSVTPACHLSTFGTKLNCFQHYLFC